MKKYSHKYKLLSLMNDLSAGPVKLDVIFREYENRYKKEMTPSDFEVNTSGNIRWRHSLQGIITKCRENGLLLSPTRAYWQITEEGRDWLRTYQTIPGREDSSTARYSKLNVTNINSVVTNVVRKGVDENHIEVFGDFFVPLMRILDSLPNRSGKSGDVLRLFEQTYRDLLIPHQYTRNESGRIRWEHNVRWSRQQLIHLSFMDAPNTGIWRLTEKGHLWLAEHPTATHLSVEKSKPKRTNRTLQTISTNQAVTTQTESKIEFLTSLQENLSTALQSILASVTYQFVQRSNYLQIRIAGFSGCHYEIILRRDRHEIALHFESSAERSQARLRLFEPHLDKFRQAMKLPVQAGSLQRRGWTQVRIENYAQPLSKDLVQIYTDLVSRFVTATFPILQTIYVNKGRTQRPQFRGKLDENLPMHQILDQEIENIRAYLQGRSSIQPSDEKLCDWINFCYTFTMYTEGKDLFSFVSGSEVNPWYYERTKKIAKVCEQKAKLGEMRGG